MTVLIANSTVTITSAAGATLASGVSANFQPDGSGDAQIPRLLAGAGASDGDYRYAYRVRVDVPDTLPGVGDTVTVVTHNDIPALVGTDWAIWREPETNNLLTSVVMRVVRKVS